MADTIYLSTATAQMTDYPFILQALAGDPEIDYPGNEVRGIIDAAFKQGGVAQAGQLQVTQNGAGDNSVNVSPGYVVIPSGTIANGKYLARLESTLNFATGTVAPPSGTVIHRLVAEALDPQVSGGATYGWQLRLIISPTGGPPATPTNAVSIATIARNAGAPSILTGAITNTAPLANPLPTNPSWNVIGSLQYRLAYNGTLLQVRGRFNAAQDGWALPSLPVGFRPSTDHTAPVSVDKMAGGNAQSPHFHFYPDGTILQFGTSLAGAGNVYLNTAIPMD